MNIICKLFGHQPPSYGQNRGSEYTHAIETRSYLDGCGRPHITLKGTCPRCNKEYIVCKVHAFTVKDYNAKG